LPIYVILNRLNIRLNSSQASSVRISMRKSFITINGYSSVDILLDQTCCGPFSFWVWKILNIHDEELHYHQRTMPFLQSSSSVWLLGAWEKRAHVDVAPTSFPTLTTIYGVRAYLQVLYSPKERTHKSMYIFYFIFFNRCKIQIYCVIHSKFDYLNQNINLHACPYIYA
jgi:hypothetical protein